MEIKKNKIQKLSQRNWIVKSNTLNEIRNNKMSPTQLRFFSIYLSKINSKDEKTRLVTFKLDEYTRIMGFKQTNITRLNKSAEDLLSLTATFKEYNDKGRFIGMTVCQLFKRFKLYQDDRGDWFVSIDCHDDILPYMFNVQKYFFKYQLWNALRLGTVNQIRMYEILKQYELAGVREINLFDLRSFLDIAENEYRAFSDFRKRILDACQQELLKNTDIKFTYEPIKKGRGGKITALKFTIEHNEDYIDQLTLNEFINTQTTSELTNELKEMDFKRETHMHQEVEGKQTLIDMKFFSSALNNEFTIQQVELLYKIAQPLIKYNNIPDFNLKMYDYLNLKYRELNVKKDIKHRFGYLKKLIELDSNS